MTERKTTPINTVSIDDLRRGQRVAWVVRDDGGLLTGYVSSEAGWSDDYGSRIAGTVTGSVISEANATIWILEDAEPTPLERLKAALDRSHTAKVYDDESVLADADWLSELVIAAQAVVDEG